MYDERTAIAVGIAVAEQLTQGRLVDLVELIFALERGQVWVGDDGEIHPAVPVLGVFAHTPIGFDKAEAARMLLESIQFSLEEEPPCPS